MQPSWTGRYINLDRAADRRASIESEVRKAEVASGYQRFRAVEGIHFPAARPGLNPGEIGCFRSHAEVLALDHPAGKWLHILEDDAMVSSFLGPIVERFLAARTFEPYDLIFTDIIIAAPHIGTLRNLKVAYDRAMANAPDINLGVIDLQESNFAGTNSYFVNPASIAKVRVMLEGELANGGPATGIDMLYRAAVREGRLKAACVFPFISRVHLTLSTQTTIGAREFSNAYSIASDLLRLIFYLDCDPTEVEAALAPLRASRTGDRHMEFLLEILRILIGG